MPLVTEVKKKYGPSGLGEIRVLVPSKTVKVISSDGDLYPISFDNVNENIVELIIGKKGASRAYLKRAYFQLSQDENSLMGVRPWEDSHFVKFSGFTRRGGEESEPKFYVKKGGMRPGRGGGEYWEDDRLRFTSVLEIVAGPWKGYSLLYGMDYLFELGDNGLSKIESFRQTWADRLEGFLDLAGFDRTREDIPYSPNVLPWLEETLKSRSKEYAFQAHVENGWIKNDGGLTKLPTGVSI
jgi:hypothetical protein